ncbi:MAG: tetratricopeptide repeat protein, partial [Oscillospiraceae bacterium]|nr:tetratricopeptide repeat protein [Oscillospiraceae bacterium]
MKRIIAIGAALALLITLFAACAKAEKPLSATELFSLSEKYLLEQNYEQAVAQLLGVIEVEPKNARAYIGAAEAYIALGKPDKAIEVLSKGLDELPDSPDILVMLYELTKPEATPEPTAENVIVLQIGNPNMTVNGVNTAIDGSGSAPLDVSGSTMIPLRGLLEAMGGAVTYDEFTGVVSAKYCDSIVELKLDSADARLNGLNIALLAATSTINGAMYCPAELIAYLCKGEVEWDNSTQSVTLTYSGAAANPFYPANIATPESTPTPETSSEPTAPTLIPTPTITPTPTPTPTPAPTPTPTPAPTPI